MSSTENAPTTFHILKTKILLLRVVSHTSCPCIRISAVNLWEGIFSHKNYDSLENENNGYLMYMDSSLGNNSCSKNILNKHLINDSKIHCFPSYSTFLTISVVSTWLVTQLNSSSQWRNLCSNLFSWPY